MNFAIHTDCKKCGRMINNTKERKKLYELYNIEGELCVWCINQKNWEYRK